MIGPVSLTMSFVANHTDGGYDEEGDDDYEEYLVAQLCIFHWLFVLIISVSYQERQQCTKE